MDFDPSEFLAMAMSEDQDATYTAPDIAEPHSSVVTPQHNMLSVTGGLQMEGSIHIPVPTFGALDEGFYNTAENGFLETPFETDTDSPDLVGHTSSPSQLSPVDRTNSPHPNPTVKKPILTTFEETRFRKDFFSGKFERVKLFRLHCTICDRHLGCAPYLTVHQMRTHKLLSVSVCRKCFEFYGDINFPIEDDSEIYCCWCGQGGDLYCCSACPKTVCKKCVGRNFGDDQIKKIDENDNWKCFVCDPTDIYPHRAMFWGLQRYGKEMRQRASSMSKEEKTDYLSKDSSHCCQRDVQCPSISLPYKAVMSKVPHCLIAAPHRAAVKNQPDSIRPSFPIATNHIAAQQMFQQTANTRPMNVRAPISTLLQNHFRDHSGPASNIGPSQQRLYTGSMKRPAPYSVPRPTNFPPRPSQPTRHFAPSPVHQNIRPKSPFPEVIDLVEQSSPDETRQLQNNHSEINIGWLEKGVHDVNQTVRSIKLVLQQFYACKNDLKKDFANLTSFSDQLSHNIKIAICKLAKINQDMVDSKKVAIDEHVNSVVSNIRASVISPEVNVTSLPRTPSVSMTPRPRVIPIAQKEPEETVASTSSQGDEDMSVLSGELPAALLCETVMEVEGNKENEIENSNKHKTTPRKERPKPRSLMRGKSSLPSSRRTQRQTVPVIDLIDDEFDASYLCKKYKITPCKVVLTKLTCN